MTQSPSSADRLYESGMQALQTGDRRRARTLLVQAVRLDPRHARAWAALLRVCADPGEQLYCLYQLGRISPRDPRLRQALEGFRRQHPAAEPRPLPELAAGAVPEQGAGASAPPVRPDQSPPAAAAERAVSPLPDSPASRSGGRNVLAARRNERRAGGLLLIATRKREAGDLDGALNLYREVLRGDPAHEEALAEAVRILSRQGRLDEARDWLEYGIQQGNRDPGAYISLAELRLLRGGGDPWEPLKALRRLPGLKPQHLLGAAGVYWKQGQLRPALEVLHEAEKMDPEHQAVLMRLAQAYGELGYQHRAEQYLKRVVDLGTRTAVGQEAEGLLLESRPHIPRHVQVHMLYALREVLGIFLFFFLIAILDAGVSVVGISPAAWGGLLLSVVGGYLLVSATSSPSQKIFQRFLPQEEAGKPAQPRDSQAHLPSMVEEVAVPSLPMEVRYVLGAAGTVLLAMALLLVLRNSLTATQETLNTLSSGQLPPYLLDIFNLLMAGQF